MRCQDVKRLINPYLNGQLSNEEMKEFIAHIEGCPSCYDELEIYYTIHYMLAHDAPASSHKDGTSFDISKELKADIERHKAEIEADSRMRRIFALIILGAEIVLAASIVVSFIPQDYKDIVLDIIEFFSW